MLKSNHPLRILHTEASPGWGGQELRILKEAKGMRARGYTIVFALNKRGKLLKAVKEEGFKAYAVDFKRRYIPLIFTALIKIILKEKIEIINTHSSLDAWLGGLAARICRRPIIRTRHLSTPVQGKCNSWILYNRLADIVVTTCEESAQKLRLQALMEKRKCFSVPTGVSPFTVSLQQREDFRQKWGLKQSDFLVGTLCILRGWKGVGHFLEAAKILKPFTSIKWMVVGDGVGKKVLEDQCRALEVEDRVLFTGYLSSPYAALAAMDTFALLSWANEGVSQASLQAAWLKKPLITTPTGGLREVCLHKETGMVVKTHAPKQVADAVLCYFRSPDLREKLGEAAHQLVRARFSFEETLAKMEEAYAVLRKS